MEWRLLLVAVFALPWWPAHRGCRWQRRRTTRCSSCVPTGRGPGWSAIGLICADLALPVPQATVIAALGVLYGTVIGGTVGAIGQIAAGALGYGLMWTSARHLVKRLVGDDSLARMQRLFDRSGAWAIVLTRSLPYSVPEALVCLAGIAGMPVPKFLGALALGSIPTAFVFAGIGEVWAARPRWSCW